MLKLLRQYWPAIFLSMALLLVLDGTISSLLTCHPPPNNTSHNQNGHENCTVFQGPLSSLIVFIGEFFEAHDKGIVAAFTVILAISTILLWDATKKSIKLASDEFISTHRPRLIVRQLVVRKPIIVDHTIIIDYSIINLGETDAIPRFMCFQILLWNPIEGTWFPDLNQNVPEIHIPPIVGGQRVQVEQPSSFTVTSQQLQNVMNGTLIVTAIGELIYNDRRNVARRTGFRRVYDPKTDWFIASPSTDHEYCD
jgi:hypothetical protein